MKKAPVHTETKAPSKGNDTTITTKSGRRGASSLWCAERALHGKQLTPDDVRILSEALANLQQILGGAL
jgi:hypothetical protein